MRLGDLVLFFLLDFALVFCALPEPFPASCFVIHVQSKSLKFDLV